MLALIDGDIVAHRVAWTTENDADGIARFRADEMLDGILVDTGADAFTIYLSDSAENNFRYKVYREYKANRAKLPRPKHLDFLKEYLITRWSAKIAYGQEADDALGIGQGSDSIICSIDKDLLQIPGKHYNFVKKEWNEISVGEGLNRLYQQILMGDTSDNIGGCPGIGPVKAERALRGLGEELSLARAVFREYVLRTKAKTKEAREELRSYIEKVGRVLKIRQQEDEPLWHFPLENLMEEFRSPSTPQAQEAVGPSMEPTNLNPESGSQSVGEQTVNGMNTEKQT